MRILLVDDSEYNRVLIQVLLKNTKCSIDQAVNGRDAVDLFRKNQYDMVLMDIIMPVMDGYRAVEDIRSWEKENHLSPTPIVAMTAYTLQEDYKKVREADFDSLLEKPINKSELIDVVENYRQQRLSPPEKETKTD